MRFRDLIRGGLAAALLLLAGGRGAAGDVSDHPAQAVARATTTEILTTLERDPRHREDLPALYALVERVVVPHLDLERMATRVLGRYWRTADEGQRAAFQTEFKALLMRTYGTALASYAGEKVKYLATRERGSGAVTVRTTIDTGGPTLVPVDYQMTNEDGQWKVYDMTIEGVSLVTTFRASFGQEIRAHGIDSLIARLRAKNREESR